MKKTYMQPEINVVLINTRITLLAGSGSTGDTSVEDAFGGDAGSEDVGESRSFDFWGDEE